MEGSAWGRRWCGSANDVSRGKPSSAPRTLLRRAEKAAVDEKALPRGTAVQLSRLSKQGTVETGMQFTL